jgi:hypothetical protein
MFQPPDPIAFDAAVALRLQQISKDPEATLREVMALSAPARLKFAELVAAAGNVALALSLYFQDSPPADDAPELRPFQFDSGPTFEESRFDPNAELK